jgi:hypothetical protein
VKKRLSESYTSSHQTWVNVADTCQVTFGDMANDRDTQVVCQGNTSLMNATKMNVQKKRSSIYSNLSTYFLDEVGYSTWAVDNTFGNVQAFHSCGKQVLNCPCHVDWVGVYSLWTILFVLMILKKVRHSLFQSQTRASSGSASPQA